MTSRNWKDRREKERFREALLDHFEGTTLVADLTLAEEREEMYWEDCANGLFDDDPYGDWINSDPYEDEGDLYDDYGYLDFLDTLDDDLVGLPVDCVRAHPGNHIRNGDEKVWLVLETGDWANILTGEVIRPRSRGWVSKEAIVFE